MRALTLMFLVLLAGCNKLRYPNLHLDQELTVRRGFFTGCQVRLKTYRWNQLEFSYDAEVISCPSNKIYYGGHVDDLGEGELIP